MRTMRAAILAGFLLALTAPASGAAAPQPGSLDTTFGGGTGIVTRSVLPSGSSVDGAASAATPDGGFVVAGTRTVTGTPTRNEMVLAKYTAAGSVDTTFGNDSSGFGAPAGPGTAVTGWAGVGAPPGSVGSANAVLVLPDGSIIVAGSTTPPGGSSHFALVHWKADGSSELGFAVTDVPGSLSEQIDGLTRQADGKIVAVGTGAVSGADNEFAFARYDIDPATGAITPDTTFDGDGIQTVNFGPEGSDGDENGTAIVSLGGRLVGVGTADDADGNTQFAVAGLKQSGAGAGSLDTTFGSGGKLRIQAPPGRESFGAAATVAGSSLLVGGASIPAGASSQMAAAKLGAGDAPDPLFGGDGVTTFPFTAGPGGAASALAIAVDPDGKVLLAGRGGPQRFGLARLRPDGSLDPGFGTGGTVSTDIPFAPTTDESVQALVLRPNGAILAVGQASTGGGAMARIEMAQYAGGGSADVSATLTSDHATLTAGDSATLTGTLRAAGPDPATGAALRLVLPAGLALTTAPSGCAGTTTIDCAVGTVAPGDARVLAFGVRALSAGSQTATATASGSRYDAAPANDGASTTIAVSAPPGPPPPPDTGRKPDKTPPKVTFVVGRTSLRKILAAGRIPIIVRLSEAGTVDLKLSAGRVKLASGHLVFVRAARATTRLKLTTAGRRALGGRKTKATMTIDVTARDKAKNRVAKRATAVVRR